MRERIGAYIIDGKEKGELHKGYVDDLGELQQGYLTRIDDHLIVQYIPEVKMQIDKRTPDIEITSDMVPGLPLRTN